MKKLFFAAALLALPFSQASAKTFEYDFEKLREMQWLLPSQSLPVLKKRGAEGWELIYVEPADPYYTLVFKREIP